MVDSSQNNEIYKHILDKLNHTSYTNIINTNNDKYKLQIFAKIYELLSIKDKKLRKSEYNINNIKITGLFLLSQINKWNTNEIVKIIINNLSTRVQQIFFYFEILEYLLKYNSYQLSFNLIELLQNTANFINHIKKQIASKALTVTENLIKCCGNDDILPFIPTLLDGLKDTNNIPEAIQKLAGCIFVQNIEFRALAVMVPILQKGLKYRKTETKRKSCIIIDNMCKLVEDPKEIYNIAPLLKPLLVNCAENISNPEARNVANNTLNTLINSLKEIKFKTKTYEDIHTLIKNNINCEVTDTMENLVIIIQTLTNIQFFCEDTFKLNFKNYLVNINDTDEIALNILNTLKKEFYVEEEKFIDTEEGADLYQGDFSLAYGALTLINNTFLHLKKNRFYGLLGPNNCGKTTLMRAIANEQVEGFPKKDQLKTIFVEHEIEEREIGEDDKGYPIFNIDLCGIEWVVDCCNEVYKMVPPVTRDQVEDVMQEIGFGNSKKYPGMDRAADAEMGVTTYSGGWKMKMQLCAATLMNADILLLDEPTGHLDIDNIAWLKNWLSNFKNNGGSIICTSHDSAFLNEMCTHIIDFQKRKLVMFRDKSGNVLEKFVEKYPEKKGYFELKNDIIKFDFPVPRKLNGKNNKGLIQMKNVTYQYPIRDKPTVMDISLTCSLSSRVSVVGPNGAGKSTAIKLLIGELKPSSGEIWKNPNARIAYVAQHAFQHLEKHIKKTPTQYILWRFAGNEDKESVDFKASIDEDKLEKTKYYLRKRDLLYEVAKCRTKQDEAKAVQLDNIHNRKENKKLKTKEYEVSWVGHPIENKIWVIREILIDMGEIQKVQRFDEKVAAQAGLMDKPLTANNVEKHLAGFGITPEQSSHTLIGSLSGGQKVKVVLAASLWLNPHLIILDEPTNYLDRDGLGALTKAIEEFKGGVIIISHNREFANAVSQEKWIMEKGRLRKEGESIANLDTKEEKLFVMNDTIKDRWGNDVKIDRNKVLDKKTTKRKIKTLKKKIKQYKKMGGYDEEIYDLEDEIFKLKENLENL